MKYIYLGEVSADPDSDGEAMANIEKLSKHLEIPELYEFLQADTPKLRRQLRSEGLKKAQAGMEEWVQENVLGKRIVVRKSQVGQIKIFPENDSFADVLIRSDEPDWHNADANGEAEPESEEEAEDEDYLVHIYPAHKSLLRSEFFTTMFTSPFLEGLPTTSTSPLPIIPLPLPAPTLPYLLLHLYLETPTLPPLQHSLSLLYTSDLLLLDRLKSKCAQVIATVSDEDLPFHIYDVIRAAWATRVPRLEAFGAKYIAERLEDFLLDPEFAELVAESAGRIKGRQETDTIELVDDIRYYLDERFRMRVDDNLAFCGNREEEEEAVVVANEVDRSLKTEKGHVFEELLGRIDALLEGLRLDA